MDTYLWVIVDQRTDDEDARIRVIHHDLGEAITSMVVLDGPKPSWIRVSRDRWEARLDGRAVLMAHRHRVAALHVDVPS